MEDLVGNYQNVISIGIFSLLFISGIMGLVFMNFVKKTMNNLDKVGHIEPLLGKVELLVEKVEKIFTSLEVTKEVHKIEIDNMKKQIEDIYKRLNELEGKR